MSSDAVQPLKIGDFAQVKGGKRMPAGTALVSVKTQHPYLRIVDFKDGSIDKSNLQYVPDEVFPSVSRYTISSNDLYISIVGTIGLVGKVPVELSGANLTENAAKICQIDPTVMNRDYLGYFLRSEMGQGAISSMTVGSTQPKLALFRIEQIEVPCLALGIQESIVSVLNALDDRITLLRETNTTLEAIAQALFKSWFVDFDPVHAKMQGRAPEGMDQATAALFPDSFEESELGPVPKGWIHCSLKEVCAIFDSKRVPLSGAERSKRQGPYPYYGAASLMDYVDDYLFDGIYLLTGEDGSVADEHGFPITQYVWGKFWVNNHAHILQGKAGFSTEHLALALRRVNIEPFITGAVQAKLSQSNMWRINVLNPGHDISAAFGLLISPLYEAIRANEERAKTLSSVRDILLPRLISGQLLLSESPMTSSEYL
jgi:restriction endonuclease S subunit